MRTTDAAAPGAAADPQPSAGGPAVAVAVGSAAPAPPSGKHLSGRAASSVAQGVSPTARAAKRDSRPLTSAGPDDLVKLELAAHGLPPLPRRGAHAAPRGCGRLKLHRCSWGTVALLALACAVALGTGLGVGLSKINSHGGDGHGSDEVAQAFWVQQLAGGPFGYADSGWGARSAHNGSTARFAAPLGLVWNATAWGAAPSGGRGVVLLADALNSVIRAVDAATGGTRTLAGNRSAWDAAQAGVVGVGRDGPLAEAAFYMLLDLALDTLDPSLLWVAELSDSGAGVVRRANGSHVVTLSGDASAPPGAVDGAAGVARWGEVSALEISALTGAVYAIDADAQSVRRLDRATLAVDTLAGGSRGGADGVGTAAQFNGPADLLVDDSNATGLGDVLYVADADNYAVRRVVVATRNVTTLCGSIYGTRDAANPTRVQFHGPHQLAWDPSAPRHTKLLVADAGGAVRRVDVATGATSIVAGDYASSAAAPDADGYGTAAIFKGPWGLTADPLHSIAYLSSWGEFTTRRTDPPSPGEHNIRLLTLTPAATTLVLADSGGGGGSAGHH